MSRGRWRFARHLRYLDQALIETLAGRGPRQLIIQAPPRHGKSELISRYLPAWYLGTFPDRRVILVSREATLARSFGRRARDLLFEHGPSLFGVELQPGVARADEWDLANRAGGMLTAGLGGPITGRGANLLIVDDYLKNAEEALSPQIRDKQWDWWQSTALTRLEPGGQIVVMATRWHTDDLIGRMLAREGKSTADEARVIRLPALAETNDPLGRKVGDALWPERWPAAELRKQKATLDPAWWQALYQQQPTRHRRHAWPDSYFGDWIWAVDWPAEFAISVLAIDPSQGKDSRRGDYSAILFAGYTDGRYWIDADLARRPPSEIVADGLRMIGRYRPEQVILEANQFQDLLAPEFQRQARLMQLPPVPLRLVENRVAKELRISRLGPYLEQNLLRFRVGDGCRLLLQQMCDWPFSQHDDGPDALELALRGLAELSTNHREES